MEDKTKGVERKTEDLSDASSARRGADSTSPRGTRNPGAGNTSRTRDGKAGNERGAELERRVARLEFAEGALARLRVPVRSEGEGELTDVDVLTLDVDGRLNVRAGIHECKSGRGQKEESDRLFWLAGLRTYLSANRATLVRQTVTRRGQAVARRVGVRILDDATLTRREAAHAWLPDVFAHVAGPECMEAEKLADAQLKGVTELPSGLLAFLKGQALTSSSGSVLSALIALRDGWAKQGGLPEPASNVIAGHALLALFVAALRDAASLDVASFGDLRARVEQSLTLGGSSGPQILNVLSSADAIMRDVVEELHERYTQAGLQRIDFDVPGLRDAVESTPDQEIDSYLALVERLKSNPSVAAEMLQTAELSCFDAGTGGSAWKAAAFDHLFTPEHRYLLLVGLQCLETLTGTEAAKALSFLGRLEFDRSAPAVPDRSSRRAGSKPSEQAPLWIDSDVNPTKDR